MTTSSPAAVPVSVGSMYAEVTRVYRSTELLLREPCIERCALSSFCADPKVQSLSQCAPQPFLSPVHVGTLLASEALTA